MKYVATMFVITGILGAQIPSFEVASIRRNVSGDPGMMIQPVQGGRLHWVNVPARMLIMRAYRLQDFQLAGGPGWIDSERFDIDAKVPDGPANPERMSLMVRSLLLERFHLTVHTESRDMPMYALVVANKDGKLGPEMRRSELDCPASPGCGTRMSPGQLVAGSLPAAQLGPLFSQLTRRMVVDRTELAGNFDVRLKWTPDELPVGPPPPGAPLLDLDPNGPSLATALQEQLGLKLESQKGPVDVVVIDKIEPPSVN